MNFITKNIKRLIFARNGIWFAIKTDYSFRMQWYTGLVVGVVVLYIFNPLSPEETLFLLLGFNLILITELQNSAFEAALDHLHPELHDNIGRSKDMAAGAVLLAALYFTIILSYLVYVRIF